MGRRQASPLIDQLCMVQQYIDNPRNLTDDQREAVLSDAKITLVTACPGSGKTRLFAARYAYGVAKAQGLGVAALSFTNVAQQEIARRADALHVDVAHPHFVGTLDSFLFRFVVRVFGNTILKCSSGLELMPEGFIRNSAKVRFGAGKKEFYALDLLDLMPSTWLDTGSPRCFYRLRGGRTTEVRGNLGEIIAAKDRMWRKTGKLTFGDSVYIAARCLEHGGIRDLVTRRFPTLLIDEFQDTTGFRINAVLQLLKSEALISALLVGDPDQCIMDFAGADPRAFEEVRRLADVKEVRINNSHRFHENIARIAGMLAGEHRELAGDPKAQAGPVRLVVHDVRGSEDVRSLVDHFRNLIAESRVKGEALVLTWRAKDANRFSGVEGGPSIPGSSRLGLIVKGVSQHYAGRSIGLFRAVEQVLANLMFDGATVSRTRLVLSGIDPIDWKRIVWGISLHYCLPLTGETWNQWAERVRDGIQKDAGRILKRKAGSAIRTPGGFRGVVVKVPGHDGLRTTIQAATVHSVKGLEFEAVCFYIPEGEKPEQTLRFLALRSPDSPTGTHESPARVAFVAVTRARRVLLVAIPSSWYSRLRGQGAGHDFLSAFENGLLPHLVGKRPTLDSQYAQGAFDFGSPDRGDSDKA